MSPRARRSAATALSAALLGVACGGKPEDPGARGSSEVRVAVAANFAEAHERLAGRLSAESGLAVRTSSGSSGQLFAQIVNGAPFDVFLSADTTRPARLEREGYAVPGSRFTYASGRLVLYGAGVGGRRPDAALLREAAGRPGGIVRRMAIANPHLAPYGEAARQALGALGVWRALEDRIVLAENVGQAFQFVESGAAELGWVAGSYVAARPPETFWVVPAGLHDPIRQDAVLLAGARDPEAGRAYLDFLRGDEARRLIEEMGYVPPGSR